MNGSKPHKATRNERRIRLRARLRAREQRLLAGLRDVEYEGALHALGGPDEMDAASESVANDLRACVKGLRTVELAGINDAFDKLFDGTYGVCEECGKRIPEARLRLVPAVSLCVGCQRRIERQSDNPLDPPEWSGTEVAADGERSEVFSGQARRRF